MRLAAALALLVVVFGGAWLLRENGIALGRDSDGPLELLSSGMAATQQRPGDLVENVDLLRTSATVEIERVTPRLVSPGLELLGPVLYENRHPSVGELIESWPPPRTRSVAGARVGEERSVGYGMRAAEPGHYYLVGMRYRYRQGVRRFDELDDTGLCLHVSREPDFESCPPPDRLAGFEGLAEIGGPSDYRKAKLTDEDGAVFTLREGGTLELEITISNLGDEARRVDRLDLGQRGDPDIRDGLEPLPPEPAGFTIPAGGAHRFRVRALFRDCDAYAGHQSRTFQRIEAGDDDVELAVPVTVTGPCRQMRW